MVETMHASAFELGRLFFNFYWRQGFRRILDIGSLDINGSLRQHCPPAAEYVGIDCTAGPGVDLVLEDPYQYPFPAGHFDLIVSTSCFEHDPMFWLTFVEASRVLSPDGFLYLNAPSNGWYHAHPWDNWRFYPDAALALERWAQRSGMLIHCIESFTAARSDGEFWNDCVMVFGGANGVPKGFVCDVIPVAYNIRKAGNPELQNPSPYPEDMRIIIDQEAKIRELTTLLAKCEPVREQTREAPPALKRNHDLERTVSLASARDPAALGAMLPYGCAVCGSREFGYQDILWQGLINEWQLSPDEAIWIDIQQGFHCKACRNNLRSIVLARAISGAMCHDGTLTSWISSPAGQTTAILEINEAGGLTRHLQMSPGHQLVSYPAADIHSLPFEDCSFDLVAHSDTLEHVPNPMHALSECRRVLRTDGVLAFTIPMVVARMTRSREGLPPSFHGSSADNRADLLVQSEFGADAWTLLLRVGFDAVTIYSEIFPAGLAFAARK
jgi:SAM-dependent methyltransferase